MNYEEFIDRVGEQVREESAWPDDQSRLSEQVHMSFLAALAVGAELPLNRLELTSSTLSGNSSVGTASTYPLPNDVYDLRGDLGFSHIEIDGTPYYSSKAIPVDNLFHMAESSVHADAVAFSFDSRSKNVFVINATTVDYVGARQPSEPATGDVSTTDYPLAETDAERAAQLVAFHVNGVPLRDTAAAQFNALLMNKYGANTNA